MRVCLGGGGVSITLNGGYPFPLPSQKEFFCPCRLLPPPCARLRYTYLQALPSFPDYSIDLFP